MDEEEEDESFTLGYSFFTPENGCILLDKPIDPKTAAVFVDQLYTAMTIDPERPLMLFFNSPGGDVYSTLMIVNAIQSVSNKTIGIVLGCAGSGAFYAFQACSERLMTKMSMLFWHEMVSWDPTPTTNRVDSQKRHNDYIKLNEHLLKYFKKRINLTTEVWNSVFEKENDLLFTSSECVKYNLTDKTITKLTELKKFFKPEKANGSK